VIGQGALSVTPLQMAMVTAAVANGGYLLKPRLISRILWPAWLGYGQQTMGPPDSHKLDVSDDILAKVREGMRMAVEGDHGTGKVMRGLGVTVAGKTGSAQHPPSRLMHAWFACFAPVEKPQYACVVFIEDGGHGASAAAPVARKILAGAFHVSAGSATGGPGD
jgi:cell division protein FtsI/penicillin-binding protein 2